MNSEVHKARENGAGLIIQMDGNLWAGDKIIGGDPKPQNQNGKLFQNFLERNPDLNVANVLPECDGIITRRRHVKNETQESVLDFFLVCDQIVPMVGKMKIHENDEIALVRYGKTIVKSDHKVLELELDMKVHMKSSILETRNVRKYSKSSPRKKADLQNVFLPVWSQ